MSETIKHIFITSTEQRTHPSPHTAYKVEVSGEVRSWCIFKRYSDFDAFQKLVAGRYPSHIPPTSLPAKRFFSLPTFTSSLTTSIQNEDFIESRRKGLEAYLRAILECSDDTIRKSPEWRTFLNIPETRLVPSKLKYNADTWLDEFSRSRKLLAEARGLFKKVNEELGKDEPSFRSLLSQAKKHIATLTVNIHHMELYVEDINGRFQSNKSGDITKEEISLTELHRRKDILKGLKAEKEEVGHLIHQLNSPSSSATPSNFSSASLGQKHLTEKRELLSSSAPSSAGSGRRAFGVATPPVETEETRGVANENLVQMQRDAMKDQDKYVEKLYDTILRQKHIAGTISQELDAQNDLLTNFEHEVGATEGSLKRTNDRLHRIS